MSALIDRWRADFKGYVNCLDLPMDDYNGIMEYIDEAPSVQPQRNPDEWCRDCKEYDSEKHCCPRWNRVIQETLKDVQPEIIRCRDCKFYTPMNRETKTGICNLTLHQNFCDDWFCAGAERKIDGVDR